MNNNTPFGLKYVYKKHLPEGVHLMKNNKYVVRIKKMCGKLKYPIPTSVAQFDTESEANNFYEKNKIGCW